MKSSKTASIPSRISSENGTDISFIQQLLGHNDIKTTLLYAKVGQKTLNKVKSPLDSL
ncbi:hypothetical protein LJC62_01355 [Odoribacter sp. OttesenSCG-928-A06]|nr:hypothetical protein [Odoribacter sp. OttesenSCG-928-A06]